MAERKFPSNSDKSKEQQKQKENEKRKLENRSSLEQEKPSTIDVAKKKERGPIDELIHTFIVQDIPSVKKDLLKYRIIPDLRRLMGNAAKDGIDMLLGETRLNSDRDRMRSSLDRSGNGGRNGSSGSYNSSSSSYGRRDGGYNDSRDVFDSRDYTYPNRGKAEAVLEELRNEIYEYGKSSVATFLTKSGHVANWTDYDIGWTNLGEDIAYIRSAPDGYCIVLPKPISIKDL